MDDSGQRENVRHKADQYKSVHAQWMIPQHHLKDNHAIKLMAIMYERDNAIQERNIALAEKKAAMAERDMAIFQRDTAISERAAAVMERDNALAALDHAPEDSRKTRKVKRTRSPPKKTKSRNSKKSCGGEDLNKPATYYVKPLNHWNGEPLNKQGTKHMNEWKDQDPGLNHVGFDESRMPVPVCSCTGKYQQCYKWGNGGWQSACCTTTLSMYPLPVMPNKRHSRVGGRKMSGSVFTRLLSRLAADGHDLSQPVDMREHWAKHGSNRYITIK